MPHVPHPSLFREYDIRGIVGETLFAEDAYAIGRAFASRAGRNAQLCVAYDGRLSSREMDEALCRGLMDSGARVTHLGRGPTPMLYYGVHTLASDGGIMITGSHNPPDHNGFKMMLGPKPFYGEDIRALRDAIPGGFIEGKGTMESRDIREDYVTALSAAFTPGKTLRVAWDAGNGATGEILSLLAGRLPGEHILLNALIDGTFPAHHPDPTEPKNLTQLLKTVKAERCDLGIAFDGDGDRIGVVDNEGEIIWGDALLALYAEEVLKENPGAAIIADVKASQTLFDAVARLGGKPVMWKTGHSHIKAKMKEIGAKLAGEMSGHMFFADRYYGFDDALYAAVRLLGIVSNREDTLSAWRKLQPKRAATPELRFPCAEERKFRVIEEVRAALETQGAEFNAVDGVRVQTPDGWWLLRASNTQAMLVARAEAADEAGLKQLQAALGEALEECGIRLNA